jgi:hypothetical protein
MSNGSWKGPEGGRVADRPHPLTIASWFLSPTLALVSVFISLRAVKTTESALKIAQRAYLGVSDAQVALSLKTDEALPNVYAVTLKGILHNTGNTPARIGLVQVSIVYPDLRGWQKLAYRYNGPIFAVKGESNISIVQWFQLTDAAVKELNDSRPSTSFGALFRVRYTDVFDDEHTMSWQEDFRYQSH